MNKNILCVSSDWRTEIQTIAFWKLKHKPLSYVVRFWLKGPKVEGKFDKKQNPTLLYIHLDPWETVIFMSKKRLYVESPSGLLNAVFPKIMAHVENCRWRGRRRSIQCSMDFALLQGNTINHAISEGFQWLLNYSNLHIPWKPKDSYLCLCFFDFFPGSKTCVGKCT